MRQCGGGGGGIRAFCKGCAERGKAFCGLKELCKDRKLSTVWQELGGLVEDDEDDRVGGGDSLELDFPPKAPTIKLGTSSRRHKLH